MGLVCSIPEGRIVADATISVLDDQCDSDDVCGYLLRTPLTSNEVPFVAFVLAFIDEQGNDELVTNLDHTVSSKGFAETVVFAHKKYSSLLQVRAVYERIEGCDVSAVFRPQSNAP